MRISRLLGAVFLLTAFVPNVFANEAQLLTLIKSLQGQMAELQSTIKDQSKKIEDQNQKISDLQNRSPSEGGATDVLPLPQVSGMSDAEFKERISGALGGADKWLKDLKFAGDVRLRYEGIQQSTGNPVQPADRNRFRMRLRYGFEKKLSAAAKFGFEMSTGEQSGGLQTSPGSANQSFTNLFNYKNIWVSKAYGTYTPGFAKIGPIQGVEITAGKFNNPFEEGASDLVWDRDVKPEGIYEKIDIGILKTDSLDLSTWATAGQFVLQESGTIGRDANLFGYQAGIAPAIYLPFLRRPINILTAVSYYNFDNYTRKSNFLIGTTSQANGNINVDGDPATLDVRNFDIFESYSELAIYPYGIPTRFYVDLTRNAREAVSATAITSAKDDDNAYAFGVKLGEVKKKKDIELSYTYKYLPGNALAGVFTESDFGAAGFAGHSGSVFKLGYGLTDNIILNGNASFTENTNAGTSGILDIQQRRFSVDLTWKF